MSEGRGSILFVCTGNVCRSPYLEWGLRAALESAGGPVVRLASAGVAPLLGHPMSPYMLDRLRNRGIDASEFRARELNERMVARADVVLTASREHRQLIVRQLPAAATRTFTALQFARLLRARPTPSSESEEVADLPALVTRAQQARGLAGASTHHDDIEDPWKHSRRVYARSAVKMDEVLEEILEHLITR